MPLYYAIGEDSDSEEEEDCMPRPEDMRLEINEYGEPVISVYNAPRHPVTRNQARFYRTGDPVLPEDWCGESNSEHAPWYMVSSPSDEFKPLTRRFTCLSILL